MGNINTYQPLWGSWYIKDIIGEGSFGKVYMAEKYEFGQVYYSAIKHIEFPDKAMINNMYAEGLISDEKSLNIYIESKISEIVNEIQLLYKLKGNTNIVSYEDHMIMKNPDNTYDIIIRMELLTNLNDLIKANRINNTEVIKMGIDICKALEMLETHNIIHRDIKPANIFANNMGNYKLGDFGIARDIDATSTIMTKKGTVTYMSPEIFKGEEANKTSDIYCLGLVMYKLLNNNRVPFVPTNASVITSSINDAAFMKRMNGDPLPVPLNADKNLANVVLKACAFKSKNRYKSAREMRIALINCLKTRMKPKEPDKKSEPKVKKSKIKILFLAIYVIILLLITAGALFIVHNIRNGKVFEIDNAPGEQTVSKDYKLQDLGNGIYLYGNYKLKNDIENHGYTIIDYMGYGDYFTIPNEIEGIPITSFQINTYDDQSYYTEPNISTSEIKNISVDDNNEYFSSINGVLFNKKQDTLIYYPPGRTATIYTIPNGVEYISFPGFHSNDYIKNITFPKSLKELHNYIFTECDSIEKLYFDNLDINFNEYTFLYRTNVNRGEYGVDRSKKYRDTSMEIHVNSKDNEDMLKISYFTELINTVSVYFDDIKYVQKGDIGIFVKYNLNDEIVLPYTHSNKIVYEDVESNLYLYETRSEEETGGHYSELLLKYNGDEKTFYGFCPDKYPPKVILNDLTDDGVSDVVTIHTEGWGTGYYIENIKVFDGVSLDQCHVDSSIFNTNKYVSVSETDEEFYFHVNGLTYSYKRYDENGLESSFPVFSDYYRYFSENGSIYAKIPVRIVEYGIYSEEYELKIKYKFENNSFVMDSIEVIKPTPYYDEFNNLASSETITIGGKEYSKDITTIDLTNSGISDISVLAELKNLNHLNLYGNNVSDLTPLENLTKLTWLRLTNNNITDITPLRNLVNLNYVGLGGNNITDITPLKNLTNLQYLILNFNNVADNSPLSNLTNLVSLSYIDGNLKDITFLNNLPYINYLLLSSNNIVDITPISNLVNLENLDLSNNNINDISPLSELKKINELTIKDNPITDWTPVKHIENVIGRPF